MKLGRSYLRSRLRFAVTSIGRRLLYVGAGKITTFTPVAGIPTVVSGARGSRFSARSASPAMEIPRPRIYCRIPNPAKSPIVARPTTSKRLQPE